MLHFKSPHETRKKLVLFIVIFYVIIFVLGGNSSSLSFAFLVFDWHFFGEKLIVSIKQQYVSPMLLG